MKDTMPDWAKAKDGPRETEGFTSLKAMTAALRARLFGAKEDVA